MSSRHRNLESLGRWVSLAHHNKFIFMVCGSVAEGIKGGYIVFI